MRTPRTFLFIFLLVLSAVSNAQFNKGDRMAGATIGSIIYNSGNSDISVDQIGNSTSKITSFNVSLNPSLGWFISSNTAVGASLNINPFGNKTTYEQNGTTFQSDKSNSYNIGLGGFVRHYLNSSGKMMPYGQFGFNMGISSLKMEGFFYYSTGSPTYKYTYSGNSSGGFFVNANLQVGFTKMVGENTGLDLFAGYLYGYNKNTFDRTTLYYVSANDNNPSKGINKTTTKFTNNGFLLGVGFQVFLRKKK